MYGIFLYVSWGGTNTCNEWPKRRTIQPYLDDVMWLVYNARRNIYYVNIKWIADTHIKRGRWVLKWSRATSIWACDWTIHWTGLGTQMSVLRIFLEPKPNQSYCGLSEKLLFDRESITQHIILLCAVGRLQWSYAYFYTFKQTFGHFII